MGDWAYPLVFVTAMVVMAVTIFVCAAIFDWIWNGRHDARSDRHLLTASEAV